ncbi:tail fiber domain-containing protein [Negadavirga shengliensis]|uniref:Tail fiber domain-containing protein n=1 Tax=Negadavirga shengliensis TaxID=1389218 RepID=A0ABV9T5R3_9BACT
MAIKSRIDLKEDFTNGKKLNEKQFHDLIDSMLNKRDDAFMGKWKKGTVYKTGNVVIYKQALWEVKPDAEGNPQEICSCVPPGEGEEWQTLIVPQQDDDWVVDLETGVMYAKVFDCVGIGRVFDPNEDPPKAKLEIVTDGGQEDGIVGRFLIFPKTASSPTLSLVQVSSDENPFNAFFLFGVNSQEAALTSDAPAGFIFRHQGHAVIGEEDDLDFKDGDVMMVIEPATSGSGNARVGISTKHPKAMLDVTDRNKGQFLLSPEDKEDPVFTIVNLNPGYDKNYTATGVGVDYSVFITDAPQGFLFKKGDDYGLHCKNSDINQGKALMLVREGPNGKPQAGIGTVDPCTMFHVTDGENGTYLFNPENEQAPLFTMAKIKAGGKNNYFTSAITKDHASWITDANKGFQFYAGKEAKGACPTPNLDDGDRLVVILANGKVGIGTKNADPTVTLEISDEKSGKFLFNLDDKKVNPALGIVNSRPGTKSNYFTLGANNQTAVMVTDSPQGFVLKQGSKTKDDEVDVTQGNVLLQIFPYQGSKAEGKAVFFPERSGKVGIMRTPGDFHLDVNGIIRAYSLFIESDFNNMSNEEPLESYFEKKGYKTVLQMLNKLRPIAFDWDDQATKLHEEGKQFGLKSQEVEDILQELVKKNSSDNKLSVNHSGLSAVLIKAIQEQQEIIEDLKSRVEALESKLTS